MKVRMEMKVKTGIKFRMKVTSSLGSSVSTWLSNIEVTIT